MLSIRTKIILAYTLVFGLLLLGFAYFIYQDTREAETAKLDARLESYAAKISTELSEEENESRTDQDQGAILKREIDRRPGLHAELVSPSGVIIDRDSLFDQAPDGHTHGNVTRSERIGGFSAGGTAYRSLRTRVEVDENDRPVLELALSMTDVNDVLQRLLIEYLIGIPLALFVTSLAAYGITKLAFRPMIGMVDTARQITASNLHERLTLPKAHDEVRHLGETLNSMIERIESSFRGQRQFIADASHEIRTPLTVLCSELEFAASQTTEPAVKESIQTSLLEIDRLTRLTDSLLLLAKLDASQLTLDLRPVRLDELLVGCVQRISPVANKKDVQIKVDLHDAAEIRADEEKLQRVIINLLDNAVKYAPAHSVVTASVDRVRPDAVLLRFDDTGPGIPAEALGHIFTRFYRADPARSGYDGAGLGLAIVQQLVELHGGTVSVTSTPGRGSSFQVELPAGAPAG